MDEAYLIQQCPNLAEVLRTQAWTRLVLASLIDAGLAGSLPRYLDDADADTLIRFLDQVQRLDLDRIRLHRQALSAGEQEALSVDRVAPVGLVTLDEQRARADQDQAAGLAALQAGKIASLAFAGGSGTRFFSKIHELTSAIERPNEVLQRQQFDAGDPKGLFPISPVAGLRFYDRIVAEALHAGVLAGRLPWVLLLTSSVTHARTLAYLRSADLWGFPADGFIALQQADEPRLDARGDLVVTDDGRLAWTGDGHGGVYRALLAPGSNGPCLLERVLADGVEHLVMHNVDNAAARPFAAARLGFHVREDALFTVSATRKTDPEEKVGVLMRLLATGKLEVVEYNVIDPAVASLRDPATGRLVHEAGNINTNLVSVQAIRPDIEPTLYTGKVIGSRRGQVETSSLEMLNQHLTRLLDPDRVRAYEVDRAAFFMPTKNVTGVDSVASTVARLSSRFASQLASAGAQVAPDALVDLHPACGESPDGLAARGLGPGWRLESGSRLYLCARTGPAPEAPPMGENLTLEPGAGLVVDALRPYGGLSLGERRALKVDPDGASRVSIGRGVRIASGVKAVIRIGPGARLTVPDGRVIEGDLNLKIGDGDAVEL